MANEYSSQDIARMMNVANIISTVYHRLSSVPQEVSRDSLQLLSLMGNMALHLYNHNIPVDVKPLLGPQFIQISQLEDLVAKVNNELSK